ncbi:hypothetical protein Avbf_15656 [Armadillidium vulgare]|nr:hypothetical protein Avbf_15656 [Armadillidium vulgare]
MDSEVADMLPSCTGRRKRNLHLPTDIDLGDLTSKEELSSGLDDSQQTDTDSPLKSGKFKLTIWSTVSSTLTITTFAVNQLITLSVSAQCTVGGCDSSFVLIVFFLDAFNSILLRIVN